MKITRLSLRNFQGYEALDLDLAERISVFVGPNDSGKSTILDAIRVAITGRARGFQKKESAALARLGSNGWAVELDLLVGSETTTLRRTATSLSRVEGEVRHALRQEELDALVGDRAALEACLDVWRAAEMTPDERRDLVFRLAGIEVKDDDLKASGLAHPEIRRHAFRGDWKKAEREAAAKKRESRAAARAIVLPEPEDVEINLSQAVHASDVRDELLDKMRASIANLEQKERDLNRRIGQARGREEASTEALERELAQLQEGLAQVEATEERWKEIAEALEKELGLERAVDDAVRKEEEGIHLAEQNARFGREDLEKHRSAEASHPCPICAFEHEGTPDPEAIEKLEEAIAEAEGQIQAGRKRASEGETALLTHRARIDSLNTERESLLRRRVDPETTRRRIAEIEAKFAEDPKSPEDMSALEETLKDTTTTLDRGREIVRAVESYRHAVEARKDAVTRRERLEKEASALEKMEHLCRPDGIRATLLGPKLAPIRERLARWKDAVGYEVVLTDDFNLAFLTPWGDLPHSLGSTSVRWRISLALADALAHLSGQRFLALDELSLLDKGNRSSVLTLLASHGDDYDQVLICAVMPDRTPAQFDPRTGARAYLVGAWQVMPVRAAGASA